jgi:hypothetical protein
MKKVKKMAFGGLNNAGRNAGMSANALTIDPRAVSRPANYPAGNMAGGLETLRKFAAANNMGSANRQPLNQALPFGRGLSSNPPGSSPGVSPLDGFKNLPKMSGPLGGIRQDTQNAANANAANIPKMSGPLRSLRGALNAGSVNAFSKKITPLMKKGGSVSSASKRADGCAVRGKTRA